MTTPTHELHVVCRPWHRRYLRIALGVLVKHCALFGRGVITYTEGTGFWSRTFVLRGSREAMTFSFRYMNRIKNGSVAVCSDFSGVERIDRSVKVEYDRLTTNGLRSVVLMVPMGHRCGYVGVPKGHPLHGASYGVPHPALAPLPDDEPIGKRSPIVLFCMDKAAIQSPSPESAFDVHGGVTFAGRAFWPGSEKDDRWYFGFDAAHCDDLPAPDSEMGEFNREFDAKHPEYAGVRAGRVHRTKEYMVLECDRLAEQLIGPKVRKANLFARYAVYPALSLHKWYRSKMFWLRSRLAYKPWVSARPKLQKFIRGF